MSLYNRSTSSNSWKFRFSSSPERFYSTAATFNFFFARTKLNSELTYRFSVLPNEHIATVSYLSSPYFYIWVASRVILQKGVTVKRYALSVIFRRVYSKHKDPKLTSRGKTKTLSWINTYVSENCFSFLETWILFRIFIRDVAIRPLQSLFLLL